MISDLTSPPKINLYNEWENQFIHDHKIKISEEKEGVWCAYIEETKPKLFVYSTTRRGALESLAETLNHPILIPS